MTLASWVKMETRLQYTLHWIHAYRMPIPYLPQGDRGANGTNGTHGREGRTGVPGQKVSEQKMESKR